MAKKKFEIISHTADVGIKVTAQTLEELFENAAYGMYNIICEKFHNIERKSCYTSSIEEVDLEGLLVGFLNDLIFQTTVNKLLFCEFKVSNLNKKEPFKISCSCFGEVYQKEKHGRIVELKSATFHNLKIVKNKSGFETIIIFDT